MLKRNNISSIFVLDQDEALTFYTEVLGLEVAEDMNFGPMRWLTVRVPGDEKSILLERPGAPAHDEATADQIRALVTKGAGGGWLAFTTDDVEAAFDRLVRTVSVTGGDDRDRVREHLVGLFELFPPDDPRVTKARRSLARALF